MRIVLDLSTSLAWTRPPVGIIRTERKFAQFLLAQHSLEVAFCRFDKVRGAYFDVPREDAARAVGLFPVSASSTAHLQPVSAVEVGPSTNHEPLDGSARPPPRRRLKSRVAGKVKAIAHRTIHRLPEAVRPEAREMFVAGREFGNRVHQLLAKYLRWLRWRLGATRAGITATMQSPVLTAGSAGAFQFRRDDVYTSMGLDWEYNDLTVLYRERARLSFRTMLFCYDTIPVRFPHLMSFDARQFFARYFTDLAHAADRVVAISEASKRDFLELMREVGGPQPRVDVVVLGTDLDVALSSERPPKPLLEQTEFVLCVGTIEARKNHEVLYHVWDRLSAQFGEETPCLVLVGMVGWGVADLMFRIRTNPRLKDRVLILDNLPDGELAWLYRHCLFTVFPSVYEGWGLPVVESLALGKLCICSTAPAVAEAAQGMATALDPHDTPAWYAAVLRLWRDPKAREEAADHLSKHYRAHTWQEHGAGLVALAGELQEVAPCASSN